MRNLIKKKLILGRLESSAEFQQEKKTKKVNRSEEINIDSLKIVVRDISDTDIEKRKLKKNTKGSLIVKILNNSPLAGLLNEKDIIIEVQKNKISNSKSLNKMVTDVSKKGEKTLLLTIINNNNQRRYLGVKIN